jgi:hypothetical protein
MHYRDKEVISILHLFGMRYNMAWWSILDLKTKKVYNSDEVPLYLVPCISRCNINLGHIPEHNEIIITVGPVSIEMHSGTIWENGKLIGNLIDPCRFFLFLRISKDTSGTILNQEYFTGLANNYKDTLMIKIIDNNVEIMQTETIIG